MNKVNTYAGIAYKNITYLIPREIIVTSLFSERKKCNGETFFYEKETLLLLDFDSMYKKNEKVGEAENFTIIILKDSYSISKKALFAVKTSNPVRAVSLKPKKLFLKDSFCELVLKKACITDCLLKNDNLSFIVNPHLFFKKLLKDSKKGGLNG